MNMTPNEEISIDDMRAAVEQDRANRQMMATQEITEVLRKYGCRMEVDVTFGSESPKMRMRVVSST